MPGEGATEWRRRVPCDRAWRARFEARIGVLVLESVSDCVSFWAASASFGLKETRNFDFGLAEFVFGLRTTGPESAGRSQLLQTD